MQAQTSLAVICACLLALAAGCAQPAAPPHNANEGTTTQTTSSPETTWIPNGGKLSAFVAANRTEGPVPLAVSFDIWGYDPEHGDLGFEMRLSVDDEWFIGGGMQNAGNGTGWTKHATGGATIYNPCRCEFELVVSNDRGEEAFLNVTITVRGVLDQEFNATVACHACSQPGPEESLGGAGCVANSTLTAMCGIYPIDPEWEGFFFSVTSAQNADADLRTSCDPVRSQSIQTYLNLGNEQNEVPSGARCIMVWNADAPGQITTSIWRP